MRPDEESENNEGKREEEQRGRTRGRTKRANERKNKEGEREEEQRGRTRGRTEGEREEEQRGRTRGRTKRANERKNKEHGDHNIFEMKLQDYAGDFAVFLQDKSKVHCTVQLKK